MSELGQSLLATARSEDGAWLEVYIGQPGIIRPLRSVLPGHLWIGNESQH